MLLIISVLLGAAALVAYAKLEKRLNQRPCPSCAYGMSADAAGESCPRCGAPANPPEKNERARTASA